MVTFLFTDIEGSTKLWDAHPAAMQDALARHDALVRACIDAGGGTTFKTVGDAFFAVFPDPSAAIRTALAVQRALLSQSWPEPIEALRVRMAVHTGPAERRDGDYFGPTLNRVARLLAAGHGQQVLVSEASAELAREELPAGARLESLGAHKLRDLQQLETIFQLLHPDLPASYPPLRTLSTLPNNLPQQITSFIGREREMNELKRRLSVGRLVTLTGAGGSGKTRLMLQVAGDLLPTFTDGVFLVELAALADPQLVVQTIAGVLGIREEPGRPLEATLTDWLREKSLLLLLDNCEHLLDACAHSAETLLRACPQLKLLVSSREALSIPGESALRVASLALPDLRRRLTPETALRYEAVRLFADRAAIAQPNFAIASIPIAVTVAQLCVRLDGIPLAIELAAARVRAMSVDQIAARLDDRFRLLTGGSRTNLPRQQTLRALIDWSYSLLTPEEKVLLRRLSVFVGGWTLEAAEAVCADDTLEDWQILDLLTALVDKSLVVFEESERHGRYRLLETIRQYAREKLVDDDLDAVSALRRRHRDHFAEMARDFEARRSTPEMAGLLVRVDAEYDNLSAALDFCYDDPESPEVGLRLVWYLWPYWQFRGRFQEGRERVTRILERADDRPSAARGDALFAAASIAFRQGDLSAARRWAEESLAIQRVAGEPRGLANALNMLGIVSGRQGEYAAAREWHGQALAMFRAQKNPTGMLSALTNLGLIEEYQGDWAAACASYAEALVQATALQDTGSASLIGFNYGWAALRLGDDATAETALRESVSASARIGHRLVFVRALAAFAIVEARRGAAQRAGLFWSAASALCESFGLPGDDDLVQEMDAARSRLDPALFARGEDEGRRLGLDEAAERVAAG